MLCSPVQRDTVGRQAAVVYAMQADDGAIGRAAVLMELRKLKLFAQQVCLCSLGVSVRSTLPQLHAPRTLLLISVCISTFQFSRRDQTTT